MSAEHSLSVVIPRNVPLAADPVRALLDTHVPWMAHGEVFSEQSFGAGPWPEQGWKLHVSATARSAAEVLARSLPVLLSEGVRFKVVGSSLRVLALNNGHFGETQVGKFITVYPSDDAQAVRLAVALDEATRGLPGPRVPTDRPLRPGSLVHYRYGAFQLRADPSAGDDGTGAYDLLDAAGRLSMDFRLSFYLPPHDVADPFEAAGVYEAPPTHLGPLAGRYLVTNVIGRSYRGGVYRAIDLAAQPTRSCLIKELWHDVGMDEYGRDAHDWAANEADVLAHHDGDPFLPRYYDRFQSGDNAYIVTEYLEGTPLDRELNEDESAGAGLPVGRLIDIGRGTGAALAHLHELGIVFRDFKPGNVIHTPNGGYRLVDFGLAYRLGGARGPALGLGSPPFYSPEQFRADPPAPADDVFSWGAVLHHLACGRNALPAPDQHGLLQPFARRPVTELRPDFPAALAAVIDRAVAWDAADRYPSMVDALSAFERAAACVVLGAAPAITSSPAAAHVTTPQPESVQDDELLALARAIGDALCEDAVERGSGLCWVSHDESTQQPFRTPDLYHGAAGIGLFLAELAQRTGEARYAEAAMGTARWLNGPAWARGRAKQGLHAGEGGVGFFLQRLAQLLDAPGFLTAAVLRARRVAGTPFDTLDLMDGAAGAALALVRLAGATEAPGLLDQARAAGDVLLAAARPAPKGQPGCWWEVSMPAPGLPSFAYLGLAHGAAGIGLALAELGAATGDERYLGAAVGAAELLLAQAMPGAAGLAWPRCLGDPAPGLQAHCHGAGGIGQFFLHLARHVPDPRYVEAARGAAQTISAAVATRDQSSICHGLAGDGAFLLDCWQATSAACYLEQARMVAARLQSFAIPARPGRYRVDRVDTGDATTPDLFTGSAGVGAFLLRLVDHDTRADLVLQ